MKIFDIANNFAKIVEEETHKEVVAIRVFTNCLCVYFTKGNGCRFYSKQTINWGKVGTCYFITNAFNKAQVPFKLTQEYTHLLNWTEEYTFSNYLEKVWLKLEYKIKYV